MMRGWLAGAVIAMTLMPSVSFAQKMVILVRHAERADALATAPLPSGAMTVDPPLSAEGAARADKLAKMLASANVSKIITTEYRRTKDTAQPLAQLLKLSAEIIPAGQTSALVAKIRSYSDDTVLVVGHSNTVPTIIKALGGPDLTIGDDEYDNLFVFVPATRTLTRLHY